MTADSVAKCSILKKTQFNSYGGCPYCHHNGIVPPGTKQIKYCFAKNAADRTHNEAKAAMIRAATMNKPYQGYRGISPLLAFNMHFDIIWQVVIDKMHSIDLGIVKKIFELILGNRKAW